MIELESQDRFKITGRGTVFVVENPGDLPEPNVLTGGNVKIDGAIYRVRGIETFAVGRPYPVSYSFGVLVASCGTCLEPLMNLDTIVCSPCISKFVRETYPEIFE